MTSRTCRGWTTGQISVEKGAESTRFIVNNSAMSKLICLKQSLIPELASILVTFTPALE